MNISEFTFDWNTVATLLAIFSTWGSMTQRIKSIELSLRDTKDHGDRLTKLETNVETIKEGLKGRT